MEVDGMALWMTIFLHRQVVFHFYDDSRECIPLPCELTASTTPDGQNLGPSEKCLEHHGRDQSYLRTCQGVQEFVH